MLRCARAPPNDVRFTTLPAFPRSTRMFAKRCVVRYTLRRFDRMTSSQRLGPISRRWPLGSDQAALFTLVRPRFAEGWAHRPGGVPRELHGDLEDGRLEAQPALAEVVERSNDVLVELCEPPVVRGTGETVELERGLAPEARERRGEALRPRREVGTHHVVPRAGEPDEPLRAQALARVLPQPLE